jgi:hypothetical protein
MESNFILKIREFLNKNIAILILLPLLTFFFLFISYGNLIEQYLVENPKLYSLYKLDTINQVISKISNMPIHIKSLVFDMVIYSYILFSSWLLLFIYNCYYKLSRKQFHFSLIIFEFIILFLTYVFIISPGLHLVFLIIGYVLFSLFIVMLIIYKVYFKKIQHEKE